MGRLDDVRARLQERYLRGLRAKMEALDAMGAALVRGEPDALQAIVRLAHQLRGSGASYGLPSISEAAGQLEDASREEVPERLAALLAVLGRLAVDEEVQRVADLLLVEDDPEMVALLRPHLESAGRSLSVAGTVADAAVLLDRRAFDLVILDLVLPDGDGRNLLVAMRERAQTAVVPVLVTSARLGIVTRMECLALGADRFFEKPVDPAYLGAAVSAALEQQRLRTDDAREDPLTGLPNRAALREAYTRLASLAERSESPLALVMIDLDHFKRVNDTYGHPAGDVVLRRVGELLGSRLRRSDYSARWGGEEFIVLLPNANTVDAAQALAGVRGELRSERIRHAGKDLPPVTVSAGVIAVEPGESVDEAIARADELLYLAKAAGRDRVLDAPPAEGPRRPRVLFAEDDDGVADVVKLHLTHGGFDVDRFAAGDLALEAARGGEFDLIILDRMMPGLDGLEVLEQVRQLPEHETTPVVMLTAMGRDTEIERAFDLGADDYVQKPFKPRELLARMRRLIRS